MNAVIRRTVARAAADAYVAAMSETPAFLDGDRPPVPDIVVPRGVTPFYLPRRPVRGRLVRLGPLAHALLTRHPNHPAVTRLAGQSLALAAALSTALKFRGSFSVQAKGDGPVSMLLADCTDTGALRGYARAEPKKLEALLNSEPSPGGGPASGRRLSGVHRRPGARPEPPPGHRHHRGRQPGRDGAALLPHQRAASLLRASRLRGDAGRLARRARWCWRRSPAPAASIRTLDAEAQEESWRTATMLAATLTDAELLDDALPPERLLYRLFHSEGVATDRARALSYGCRCSRARLVGILEGFPPDDLDHMAVDGDIVMTCEFCNYDFRFPRQDVRGRDAGPAC